MDGACDIVTPLEQNPKLKPLHVVAAVLMLLVGSGVLAAAMSDTEAANRDYIVYWAVGRQLIHHGNPYDAGAILPILRSAGYKPSTRMIVRNPPYALFFTLPLGLVSARAGAVLWSLGMIAALMASVRMIWIMHGRPRDRLHLVGYTFAPALACLLAGQLGIFLLLGTTAFLYLHVTRPYIAGVALFLCTLKPHLFLPFGVVLFAWILSNRIFRVLAGTFVALVASSLLVVFLDPDVASHYVRGERAENIQNLFIPCVSVLFRIVVRRDAVWLQFLPAIAGCVWGIWYFLARRKRWDWVEDGSLLLLVSVMVAPYAWFTDEAILLPAIMAGLYAASNAGRSLLPFGGIAAIALLEVIAGVPLTSGFYIWTAPAWLAWYLYAVHKTMACRVTLASCEAHGLDE
jgi:hypothetical protein